MNLTNRSFTVAAGRAAMAAKESGLAVLSALSLVLLTAGCGGGGGSSAGSSSGALKTTSEGALRLQYSGQLKPFIASSSGQVSVTGTAGSSITGLTLVPTPSLADTSIAFDLGFSLYTYNWGTGAVSLVPAGLIAAETPTWSSDGRLAFAAVDYTDGHYQIYTCYTDGSHLVKLTSDNYDHLEPSWSPDNSKIVFTAASAKHIYTVVSAGGSQAYLGEAGSWPSYSADGTKIMYTNTAGTEVEQMPSAGGVATASYAATYGAWILGADDSLLTITNGSDQDIGMSNPALSAVKLLQVGTVVDSHPTASPDGTLMAYVQAGSGTTDLVAARTASGADVNTLVSPNEGGFYPNNPSWSPFLAARSFVGTTGALTTAASGFLWSQVNSSFASLLAFVATTPSSATVTQETGGNGGAIVYQLQANNITSVYYTNSYYIPKTSITAGTPQILVTFDPTSGKVTTVAPFISAKPTAAGAALAYTGKFTAVYDGQGHNLAPNGASTITLDRKTGKLLSAR